ncbi:MAG: tetratricopeptide repeat protein [Aquaticitalea sp.]
MNPKLHITSEEWNLIEAHLDDQTVSKTSLLNIAQLEEKINHIQTLRESLEDTIRQSKIKEFHSHILDETRDLNIKKNPVKKSKSKSVWYAIAAVIVVLLGMFWMIERPSTSEKIFAENFKPDIGLPLKMGTTNSIEFYEGMVAYKQGNYKSAIDQWQALLKENPKNDTLNYFLGVSYLAEGNASKSIVYLENQEQFIKGIFKEDAAYYAALANIKEGKFANAKLLLKKNPSSRNTVLLQEIEHLK